MSELILAVLEVRESPRRFRLASDAGWWEANRTLFRDPGSRLLRPFVLDLQGYRLGPRLLFRGEVEGTIELPCGRCVEPYAHSIEDQVELLLEPLRNPEARAEGPPAGGIELDPEDLEIGRYAGEELDFGVLLREILQFNWPMQPRCAEGCLGLCPSCGANRNRETCRCESGAGARPFAALGELLRGAKPGSD